MNNATNKLYAWIFGWLALSGLVLFWALPSFADNLTKLQYDHRTQIDELQKLEEQVRNVNQMQRDLNTLKDKQIQPEDFFTSDIRLVNEIQHIESAARVSGVSESLALSGTADKTQQVPSASNLYAVPYVINLKGSYPSIVAFVEYLENSYFVAPVSAVSFGLGDKNVLGATIFGNFLIHR